MYATSCEPLANLDKSNTNIEMQWVLIHRPHSKNIVACNVYRPPNGDLQKAISCLEDCLKDRDGRWGVIWGSHNKKVILQLLFKLHEYTFEDFKLKM